MASVRKLVSLGDKVVILDSTRQKSPVARLAFRSSQLGIVVRDGTLFADSEAFSRSGEVAYGDAVGFWVLSRFFAH